MADAEEVPRHLRKPGDDGYRTPTIEDTERSLYDESLAFRVRSVGEAHATALNTINDPTFRPIRSRVLENADTNDGNSHHRIPTKSEGEEIENLSWKQRIRHFTWAYFTLTMATGGIANVLYNSKHVFFSWILSDSL